MHPGTDANRHPCILCWRDDLECLEPILPMYLAGWRGLGGSIFQVLLLSNDFWVRGINTVTLSPIIIPHVVNLLLLTVVTD